eukprot:359472-Chlamydomonas_euryale.AAC.13
MCNVLRRAGTRACRHGMRGAPCRAGLHASWHAKRHQAKQDHAHVVFGILPVWWYLRAHV